MFALTATFPWVTDSDACEAGILVDPGLVGDDFPMAAGTTQILTQRLRHQHLIDAPLRRKPAQVVSWLCAVQAQDYPGAKWAIGQRIPGSQDADIEQAFNDGLILRTHLLRPTWHFVTPDDIRWLLALSAPRVHAVNAYYYRQVGLDDRIFKKSSALIHRVLEGGKFLTCAEIGEHLKRAKIPADGLKLGYIMMHAESKASSAAARAAASSSPMRCSTSAHHGGRRSIVTRPSRIWRPATLPVTARQRRAIFRGGRASR